VKGVIENVQCCGAFVTLPAEGGVVGLLPIRHISQERLFRSEDVFVFKGVEYCLSNVGDVFKVGDGVTALVISVNPEEKRITLSTWQLEQNPGDMLPRDPGLVYANAEAAAAAWRH
jgi:ribosomal protein S1